MGLQGLNLTADATVVVTDGIEPISFKKDGVAIANGSHFVNTVDTEYGTRKQATLKARMPSLDPKTGMWSKGRASLSFVIPHELSVAFAFNTIRIEVELHPTAPSTTLSYLRNVGAQLLLSEDLDEFWQFGVTEG